MTNDAPFIGKRPDDEQPTPNNAFVIRHSHFVISPLSLLCHFQKKFVSCLHLYEAVAAEFVDEGAGNQRLSFYLGQFETGVLKIDNTPPERSSGGGIAQRLVQSRLDGDGAPNGDDQTLLRQLLQGQMA